LQSKSRGGEVPWCKSLQKSEYGVGLAVEDIRQSLAQGNKFSLTEDVIEKYTARQAKFLRHAAEGVLQKARSRSK
jgi:hypothetical protein